MSNGETLCTPINFFASFQSNFTVVRTLHIHFMHSEVPFHEPRIAHRLYCVHHIMFNVHYSTLFNVEFDNEKWIDQNRFRAPSISTAFILMWRVADEQQILLRKIDILWHFEITIIRCNRVCTAEWLLIAVRWKCTYFSYRRNQIGGLINIEIVSFWNGECCVEFFSEVKDWKFNFLKDTKKMTVRRRFPIIIIIGEHVIFRQFPKRMEEVMICFCSWLKCELVANWANNMRSIKTNMSDSNGPIFSGMPRYSLPSICFECSSHDLIECLTCANIWCRNAIIISSNVKVRNWFNGNRI